MSSHRLCCHCRCRGAHNLAPRHDVDAPIGDRGPSAPPREEVEPVGLPIPVDVLITGCDPVALPRDGSEYDFDNQQPPFESKPVRDGCTMSALSRIVDHQRDRRRCLLPGFCVAIVCPADAKTHKRGLYGNPDGSLSTPDSIRFATDNLLEIPRVILTKRNTPRGSRCHRAA